MYILDSSSIAVILARLKEEAIEVLEGSVTLDLARYELGNIIWKEYALRGLINKVEALNKVKHVASLLEIMDVERIESEEELRSVMELASELKITFYDASYLHKAKSRKLVLVTEDEDLREKAKHANVKAVRADALVEQR